MRGLVPNTGIAEQANSWVERKKLLRFVTCGSVGGGKSTLVGRLLSDCNAPAALADELASTIEIGYRYFATARRTFIVADTPGHEQYTRNWQPARRPPSVAVLLIDARKGVLAADPAPQPSRHAARHSRHASWSSTRWNGRLESAEFERIRSEYLAFAAGHRSSRTSSAFPSRALHGDNVTRRSTAMPWYAGPTLDRASRDRGGILGGAAIKPFRMPVQWVNRPNSQFRGYCGTIVSGRVRPGDRLAVLPAGTTVRGGSRSSTFDGDLDEGRSRTSGHADARRRRSMSAAAMCSQPRCAPAVAEQFAAHVIWMSEQPMLPGRSYLPANRTVAGAGAGDGSSSTSST